ncbi:DNA-binding response regulator [Butyrivibrio sp. CB08]|uniref:LytR/AlgR family response regulator transcription factor n=1 Tax=Butyrivibrio sp. CB08 TaxID=2364879 RepID=UPI000EAA88A8|nr:LytTR family DNA-binding domain-containing protein [Butyrivibrio sp. CB08]RKM61142.1 DNA-binding response regulator [Butyrivibrio sp. CB08]
MNISICDDDIRDIERLEKLIEEYDKKTGIGISFSEYKSGSELIHSLKTDSDTDAIFLDINMEGMDGLAVAKEIRMDMEDVPIILVTAYMNYALDGYKVRASRFLIKDDLDKTIFECMDHICSDKHRRSSKIMFSCVGGDVCLKAADILLVETAGHKNIIHLSNQTYQIYKKLDDMEEQLKPHGFLRIHNSFLVNMDHVRSINNYVLTLDDGRELPVPRGRYKEVRRAFALYAGDRI